MDRALDHSNPSHGHSGDRAESASSVADPRSLAALMRDLAQTHASGCLHLRSDPDGLLVQIPFIDGFVVGLASEDPAHSLTGLLVARDRLDGVAAAVLDRLAVIVARPVADLLYQSELLPAIQVDAARIELIHEALHGLALFGVRSIEFQADAFGDCATDLVIATSEIFSELELRRNGTRELRRRFAEHDLVATPIAIPTNAIGPDEERVLALLDRPELVSRIAVRSGIGRWRSAEALDRLRARAVIRLDANAAAAQSRAPEPEFAVASPATRDAAIALGRHLMERGFYQESIAAFRVATAADPSNDKAATLLATADRFACDMLLARASPPLGLVARLNQKPKRTPRSKARPGPG